MDALEESRRNTVEHCFFPGFHPGELPQLPGQLEAPQLLHRVTKAQDFKVAQYSLLFASLYCRNSYCTHS